jgi:hypothetical protein
VKIFPVIFSIILILVGICGCLENKNQGTIINTYTSVEDALAKVVYTDTHHQFGCVPPTGWCLSPPTSEGAFHIYNNNIPDAYMSVKPEGSSGINFQTTVKNLMDAFIQNCTTYFSNYTVVSQMNSIINGMTCREILDSFSTSTGVMKGRVVWMVKNNTILRVSYTIPERIFSSLRPVCDDCINSFFIFDKSMDLTRSHEGLIRSKTVESLNNSLNASIISFDQYTTQALVCCWTTDGWVHYYNLTYTKNGRTYDLPFYNSLRNALNWTRENTPHNSTILCWWDYGHSIEGYAERRAVATSPSPYLAYWSVASWPQWNASRQEQYISDFGGWTPDQVNRDIAKIFTTDNISSAEIRSIITKYNISYIFTPKYDRFIDYIIINASGVNISQYFLGDLRNGFTTLVPTEKANNSLVHKMAQENVNIYGLTLVYQDPRYSTNLTDYSNDFTARIFKISL